MNQSKVIQEVEFIEESCPQDFARELKHLSSNGFEVLNSQMVYDSEGYILKHAAVMVKHQDNSILATEEDRKLFFDTIENPREPNDALKEAFNRRNGIFEK